MPDKHLLCFGMGYAAQHLAARLLASDEPYKISGTSRSQRTVGGVSMHVYDELLILPQDITHVLISIPPKADGDVVCERFAQQLLRLQHLEWVGYLSSTAVYGDHKGTWVHEGSPLLLGSTHAELRHTAEEEWAQLHHLYGLPAHIFRLAGIYGPGRSAIDAVRAGQHRIIDKPDVIFSRIHVTDIANVLLSSMARPHPGSVYNVADDYPCNPQEVIEEACRLLGVTPPAPVPLAEANLGEMGMSFYTQSKRVSNIKIKQELGVVLAYPTYKEGLMSILV